MNVYFVRESVRCEEFNIKDERIVAYFGYFSFFFLKAI